MRPRHYCRGRGRSREGNRGRDQGRGFNEAAALLPRKSPKAAVPPPSPNARFNEAAALLPRKRGRIA